MTDEKRKEKISLSYLKTICAIKGISITENHDDEDGIDVYLSKTLQLIGGRRYTAKIDVQLKSSSNGYTEHKDYYAYPLKIKNYDDLRADATVKPYLFLLVLPSNEKEWVMHSIDKLVVKKCMFWMDLTKMPESSNASSITVRIPKANAVSPEALEGLLRNAILLN